MKTKIGQRATGGSSFSLLSFVQIPNSAIYALRASRDEPFKGSGQRMRSVFIVNIDLNFQQSTPRLISSETNFSRWSDCTEDFENIAPKAGFRNLASTRRTTGTTSNPNVGNCSIK